MRLDVEQDDDSRWLAEAPALPSVMAYGPARSQTVARVEALSLRVRADRLEHGQRARELDRLFTAG